MRTSEGGSLGTNILGHGTLGLGTSVAAFAHETTVAGFFSAGNVETCRVKDVPDSESAECFLWFLSDAW